MERVMQFIRVLYTFARWPHWECGFTQLEAATINHAFTCLSCNLGALKFIILRSGWKRRSGLSSGVWDSHSQFDSQIDSQTHRQCWKVSIVILRSRCLSNHSLLDNIWLGSMRCVRSGGGGGGVVCVWYGMRRSFYLAAMFLIVWCANVFLGVLIWSGSV